MSPTSAQHTPTPSTRPATFPADLEIVSRLFLAYAESLPISLDFQDFAQELAGLPGKFAVEKAGALYLAYTPEQAAPALDSQTSSLELEAQVPAQVPAQERVVGCVALRPFAAPHVCELKRLYLVPEARGRGVSRALMDVVLARARELGYKEMLLDTLSSMAPARRLYEGYGFVETEKYYESVDDAVFYRLVL